MVIDTTNKYKNKEERNKEKKKDKQGKRNKRIKFPWYLLHDLL